MEAQPNEPPLKVCPHCSVATRTDAELCPSCGGSYARGRRLPRLSWSWWFAIPIVIAAFLVGYFGISQLFDGDDEAGVVTLEEAQAIPFDVSRAELEERVGEPALVESGSSRAAFCLSPDGDRIAAQEVLFYSVSGQEDLVWQFCFRRDQLVGSGPTG